LPQVQNSGGPVLANAAVIPVTFPMPDGGADPLAAMADAFVAALPGTAFSRMAQEYGVQSLSAQPPIHSTLRLPATVDDALLQDQLPKELAGGLDGFRSPPAEALYVLFTPPGVTVTASGQSGCADFGGYHSAVRLSGSAKVAYAVAVRCPGGFNGESESDAITAVASHEILESASDPYYVLDAPAWANVDDAALAFGLLFGGEIADLCLNSLPAFYTPPDLPYVVQRTWSNQAARARQDPCVPAPTSGVPYFQSVPELPAATAVKLAGMTVDTAGLSLAVGQTVTVPIDLYSPTPTGAPWSLDVLPLSSGSVRWTLDQDQGVDGDQLHLTLTLVKKGSVQGEVGLEAIGVHSRLGDRDQIWPVLIETP